jgi:hypothetical protein
MRLVLRSGPIVTVLAVIALAAPNALAVRFYPPPASTPSAATSDQLITSRDGVGEGRLRAAFAPVGRTLGRSNAAASTSSSNPGARLICTPRSQPVSCRPASTTRATTAAGSHGFHYGDAVIGAALMGGLVLLGTAGTLAARRRRQPLHP